MLTKGACFDFLNSSFENASLEDVACSIDKRLPVWIAEYKKRKFEGYELCPTCGRFSKKEGFKIIQEEKLEQRSSGDSAMVVPTKVMVTYQVCPRCSTKMVVGEEQILR